MRPWTDVAVLTRTRNLKGGFAVKATAGLPFSLFEGCEVRFVPPQTDTPRAACVERVDERDDGTAYAVFSGIEDIAVAKRLVGCHCLVKRADIPADDFEHAPGTWRGWRVVDARFGEVGTIADFVEGPQQDLLEVVRPDGSTALVPVVDAFIAAVDVDARTVETTLPDGLLDL